MIQVMQELKNTTTHSIDDFVAVLVRTDKTGQVLFVISESDDSTVVIFTSKDHMFTSFFDDNEDTWEDFLNEWYTDTDYEIILPIVDRKKIKTLITIYN